MWFTLERSGEPPAKGPRASSRLSRVTGALSGRVSSGLVPVSAGMPAQAGAFALLAAARGDGKCRRVLEGRARDGADLDGPPNVGGAPVLDLPMGRGTRRIRAAPMADRQEAHKSQEHRKHMSQARPAVFTSVLPE